MRKTLLPFAARLVTWSSSRRAEWFKRRPGDGGNAHTKLKAKHQQESKDQLQELTTTSMRVTLATVAVLVLALGWTSEAVHVEVSAPRHLRTDVSVSLCPALRALIFLLKEAEVKSTHGSRGFKYLHWQNYAVHPPLILLNCFPLPGEWTDFLTRGRQEASRAGQKQQHGWTTEPATQGLLHVPVCRPHAPAGVPAPL